MEKRTHSDIKNMVFENGIDYFADNLSHPDKLVRLSTLRILCHFEPIYDGKDTDEVNFEKNDYFCQYFSLNCVVLKLICSLCDDF